MSVANAIVAGMTMDRLPDSGRLAGIATTAELVGAGFTRAAIRALARRGVLTPVCRGAYARSDLLAQVPGPDLYRDHAVRIAAAIAVVGPDAVGSHQDAAILHGLDLLKGPPADVVALCRKEGREGLRAGQPPIRVRAVPLPRDQVVTRGAVPVTSAARTVIDLARTSSFRSGVVVADSALRQRKTSKDELSAVAATCSRWPGIDRARQVVEFSDALSESPFESISRVAFRDGGLPPPELQVWVGDCRPIARVDFLWRRYATIAEADGALKYADPDRARQQLRRDAELREAGFEVVHFTWRELMAAPEQVLRSIRAAFQRSGAIRASERGTRQTS